MSVWDLPKKQKRKNKNKKKERKKRKILKKGWNKMYFTDVCPLFGSILSTHEIHGI